MDINTRREEAVLHCGEGAANGERGVVAFYKRVEAHDETFDASWQALPFRSIH